MPVFERGFPDLFAGSEITFQKAPGRNPCVVCNLK